MGVRYWEWDEVQIATLAHQGAVSDYFVLSFLTACVQYVVAHWIWSSYKSESKIEERVSSVHIIFGLLHMWILNSLLNTMYSFQQVGKGFVGYRIATIIMVFEGVLFNLLVFSFSKKLNTTNNADNASEDLEMTKETGEEVKASHSSLIAAGEIVDPESEAKKEVTKKSKPVVHYINNIKIFLTQMVILFHCVIALDVDYTAVWYFMKYDWENAGFALGPFILACFTVINTSYFMPAFFFFSGYFIPRSYDKKGTFKFFFERMKRLGIPLVLYNYIIGPYVSKAVSDSLFYIGPPVYFWFQFTGITWFLGQLMMFDIFYAILCGKSWAPKVQFPGVPKLLVFGLGLGIVEATILLFIGPDRFGMYFMTARFFDGYLYFIVFYFGGALASRNNWMEELQKISQKTRVILYCCIFVHPILYYIMRFVFVQNTVIWHDLIHHYINYSVVMGGLSTMWWTITISAFFMQFMNKKYWCTDFFSKSMYTAYIIQFVFPMQIGFYLWVQILRSKGEDIVFTNSAFPVYYTNPNYAITGFLFVGVVTTLICWPSAYLIRSIPGFSQVL